MIKKARAMKKFRGSGIAASGYLAVALSAVLLVTSFKVGQLTGLPREIYWLPMLFGIAGAVAGFVVGAGGIVITWASFGNNEVNLDWLTSRASRLQWRRSMLLFKWGAVCIVVATIWSVVASLWFESGLLLSGVFFLATTVFVYLGAVAKLWEFFTSELSRLSA